MSITREFNLFLNAGASSPLVINVNQYDQGEVWQFTLYSEKGIQYTPSTGAIVGIKSDNLGIINTGTVVDGKVVINETEQMTAAPGRAVFELLLDDQTHGTANFEVQVEPKPGNNADLSESDLSLIQQAIDSTNPTVIAGAVSDWMDDNLAPEEWVIDSSLSVSGAAADAKATGDAIAGYVSIIQHAEVGMPEYNTLKVTRPNGMISTVDLPMVTNGVISEDNLPDIGGGDGIPYAIKLAMDSMFSKAYYKGDISSDYTAFHTWATAVNLVSISAVFTQGTNVIYDMDSLDTLKQYLVVTASYDNNTTAVINNYELSGTLTEGTSTITVTYEDKTDTFNVTVTASLLYQVSNYSIDKSTAAIDTGIALLETDHDFTIMFDGIQPSAVATGTNARIMICFSSSTNWKGIMWGASTTGSSYSWEYFEASSGSALFPRNAVNGRFRLIYTHKAGSGKATTYAKYNNGTVTTKELTSAFSPHSNHLFLGGPNATAITQNWIGTITTAKVYQVVVTQAEIDAFLA